MAERAHEQPTVAAIAAPIDVSSRAGHRGFVVATLFDVDGARLFSGAAEGAINVWEVASGTLRSAVPAHRAAILALRISADGARLFSASHDGTAAVWDARQLRLLHRLRGHRGGVHALAVCDDRVATGGYDGTIRLWDADSGAAIATLAGHDDTVTDLLFARADLLVSASRDGTVRVWELGSDAAPRVLAGHDDWVTRLADAGPGRVLSAGEDGRCVLWALADGRAVWTETLDQSMPIWGLAVAQGGAFAITGGAGAVERWELESGVHRALAPATRSRRGIAISPDATLAALGGDDSSVLLYDVVGDRARQLLPGLAQGYLAAVADPSGEVVAVGRFDGAIDLLRPAGESLRIERAHAFMAYAMCRIGPARFASGGLDGDVCLWDFGGTLLMRLAHGAPVFALTASHDGTRLLSAGGDAVRLWDVRNGEVLLDIRAVGSGAHTVADLAPAGDVIVSAGEDDAVRLWHMDGTLAASRQHACGAISALRLLPDGRRAVLADARGRLWAMDLASGAGELLHEAHEDWIRTLHVTADGRYVASASQNGVSRVYDLATRRLVDDGGGDVPDPLVAVTIGAGDTVLAVSATGRLDALAVAADVTRPSGRRPHRTTGSSGRHV